MFRILQHSHSGLRYLVLVAGFVALIYGLYALFTRKPWSKGGRAMGSAFVGLFDLQIVLGLVMLNWLYYPQLIGHLAMMIIGAIVAHVVLVLNRRRANPSWALLVIGVAAALLCIVLGIYAIGRSPFEMRVA